jgi:hypothetical protein
VAIVDPGRAGVRQKSDTPRDRAQEALGAFDAVLAAATIAGARRGARLRGSVALRCAGSSGSSSAVMSLRRSSRVDEPRER